MLGLVLGLLVLAPSARPFAEERLLLDRRLETLRRILPDGASPAVDGKHVNDLAEEAQLGQIQVRGCVSSESGTSGVVSCELHAPGGYDQIERFFRRAALSHRLIDVEKLTLTSAGEGVVRLESGPAAPLLAEDGTAAGA